MDIFSVRITPNKSTITTHSLGTSFSEYANETSVLALVVGHILEAGFDAPDRWPDIHVLWNLTVCWGCFVVYWGWLVCELWRGDVELLVDRYRKGNRKVQ